MKYKINDFTGMSTIEIVGATGVPQLGPLVHIRCGEGSLSFQHSVTPRQAREMAAALIACADAQEAAVNTELAAHRAELEVVA